ncbi:MAG: hypothetical protein EPN86_04100 [Nanoarchaeota archaeon]|nr:MAG: hypothetical protein EPN86_04100 [Nanoarchaeota archaeon]
MEPLEEKLTEGAPWTQWIPIYGIHLIEKANDNHTPAINDPSTDFRGHVRNFGGMIYHICIVNGAIAYGIVYGLPEALHHI